MMLPEYRVAATSSGELQPRANLHRARKVNTREFLQRYALKLYKAQYCVFAVPL